MYKTHAFSPARPLAAAELNAMEAQLLKNEARGAAAQARADALAPAADALLRSLRLSAEGEYLTLRLGDEPIAVAARGDEGACIPPEALSVSPPTLRLLRGESALLDTGASSPADATEPFRFLSLDRAVAGADRYGRVTARGLGRTQIRVGWGRLSASAAVEVDLLLRPGTVLRGRQFGYDAERGRLQLYLSGEAYAGLIPPDAGLVIPPGSTAAFHLADEAYGFWDAWLLRAAAPGETLTARGDAAGASLYVEGAQAVEHYEPEPDGAAQRADWSWHNGTGAEVWACVRILKNFQDFTEADAAAVKEALRCTIVPDED